MSTFIDFFKQQQVALPKPGSADGSGPVAMQSSVTNAITMGLEGVDMSSKEVAKFASQLGEMTTSEPFLQELSEKIGRPELGETEDDFVHRCKQAMFELLHKRLD